MFLRCNLIRYAEKRLSPAGGTKRKAARRAIETNEGIRIARDAKETIINVQAIRPEMDKRTHFENTLSSPLFFKTMPIPLPYRKVCLKSSMTLERCLCAIDTSGSRTILYSARP